MSNSNHGPIEKVFEGLDQHSELLSKEELKAELKARGLEVEDYLKETNQLIEEYLKKQRLVWMTEADEKKRQMATAAPLLTDWLKKTRDEIETAFTAWTNQVSPSEAFGFRNRKDLTLEDKARLLNQHESLIRRCQQEEPEQT